MNEIVKQDMDLPVFDNEQAWYGAEMKARSDWIYELTPADMAEIQQALVIASEEVPDLLDLRREHFPLPTLSLRLAALRRDLLHGRGFFLVRGVPIERLTRRECAIVYLGLGHHLGEPVSQNGKGHILGHVKNIGLDFSDPETRGYQTAAQLAFHSDYSDVVGLLCLKSARAGGASTIVSSTTLWNELVKRRPDLAKVLRNPLYYTRWGEIPQGKKRYSEVPVFTPWNGRMIAFRNLRATIMKAQRFPEVPRLTEKQIEALDFLDTMEQETDLYLAMDFRPGDMQFVCNYSVFHARTGYEDWPEADRRRHLLRLWLACEDGPALPPFLTTDFQGKTGSGRPDGINVPGVPFKAPLEAE